jgi:hypothetical protein
MSKIVVDLKQREDSPAEPASPDFGGYAKPKKRGILGKVLAIFAAIVLFTVVVGAVGGFFYWRHLKSTPQYSLGLLVEAAREDNQEAMDEVVDVDAVVEDFVPQVIDKAVELYGRGVDPQVVEEAKRLATPILPIVKQRAKAELPNLIREKTKKFEDIPFWAIVVGAERYLDIRRDGDRAFVKSKIASRPLEVEMKRNGDKWQIVAIEDEQLAQRIAGKIGQEILGLARKQGAGGIEKVGKDLGIENVNDLIKKAEDIFK